MADYVSADLVPQVDAVQRLAQVQLQATCSVSAREARHGSASGSAAPVRLVVVLAFQVADVIELEHLARRGTATSSTASARRPPCRRTASRRPRTRPGRMFCPSGCVARRGRCAASSPTACHDGRVVSRRRAPAAVGADDVGVVGAAAVARSASSAQAEPTGSRRLEAVGRRREHADLGVRGQLALEARDVERRPGIQPPQRARAAPLSISTSFGAGQRRDQADGGAARRSSRPASPRRTAASDRAARPASSHRRSSTGVTGWPPDAARVDQRPHGRERVDPFQEERPLLGEERLERRQVQDDGVGLDLAEVGVERRRPESARW